MNKTEPANFLTALILKPGQRWFSSDSPKSDDGWFGPHKTVEKAALECASVQGCNFQIFVARGFKLKKAEQCAGWEWQVDVKNAFEIILPNDRTERPGQ